MIVADYVVSQGLRKTRFNEFSEWNDIFSGSINTDIIITGSSRASVHIDPRIIDSAFQSKSYNLGMDGYGFHLQNCRLKTYLKYNQPPKIIIHSLGISALKKEE